MSIELRLNRLVFTSQSTIGALCRPDGTRLAYVLEDVYRAPPAPKIPGETCIPCGRYQLLKTFSPHFGHDMWLVNNVPGYEGIRIHAGNTKADTEGCLLVGYTIGVDKIGESLAALAEVTSYLDALKASGNEIWLTVSLAK